MIKKYSLILIALLCSISFSYSQATLPVNRAIWNAGAPTGWTDFGTSSYTTTFACSGLNGGRLDADGDYYEVFFNTTPDQLSYVIKFTGNTTSTLLVEESDDGIAWNTINSHAYPSPGCHSFNFGLNSTTRYVRWTYNKTTQNLTLDDVNITQLSTDEVDWCNLQFPEVGSITTGGIFDVFGQVYEAGVTPGVGQGAGIAAWVGYSTTNTNPNTWTNWVPAGYNAACADCNLDQNDEYFVDIGAVISTAGTYYYATRFQLNGGPYRYGGILANGTAGDFWDGSTYISGVLTVNGSCTPIFSDDFSGTLGSWTQGTTNDWTTSGNELKHNLSSVAGESYIYSDIGAQNLNAGNYEWNVCMRIDDWDPSGGNNFAFILLSDDTDLQNNTTGYAVGMNQVGITDLLTLYSVNNGTYTAIITSTFNWDAFDDVCVRVTRNTSGDWELLYDPNNTGEVSGGTATNNSYSTGDYIGGFFDFTATRAGRLWIDDVSVCSDVVISGPELQLVVNSNSENCNYNLNFGNVESDGSTLDLSVFVQNNGSSTLDINSLTIADNTYFDIVSPTAGFPIPIAPGLSQEIVLRFTATVNGAFGTTLTISNTDGSDGNDETSCVVNLSGTGVTNTGSGDIMITQYYEGSGLNKWIEIRNVSGAPISANSYYIATYNQGSAPTYVERPLNGPPNQSVGIPAMAIDEVMRFKEPATLIPSYAVPGEPGYDGFPTQNMFVGTFSGDDIIVVSPSNGMNCYSDRIDIIGEYSVNGTDWGNRRCFVRNECTASTPSITFNINDWVEFTDTEVASPLNGTNPYLGQHYIGSTTFASSAWDNGLPDRSRGVFVSDNYDTSSEMSFEACSLTITGSNTLDITDGNYVGIVTDLTVNTNAILEIRNQGQLVMMEDTGIVTNNGTTNVRKTTASMNQYDYVYWSSPVNYGPPLPPLGIALVLTEFMPNRMYSFNTAAYQDDLPGINGDGFDDDQNDWVIHSSVMDKGVGYATMTANTTAQVNNAIFSGKVNNGIINVNLSLSADVSGDADDDIDDWNLIGNPYPSAISADSLVNQNSNMDGTIYFWTHNTPIAGIPGPDAFNFSANDYAMYNATGGVGTAAGSGGAAPTGRIASGQGFFIDAVNNGTVTFNNSMRNIAIANDDFFRNNDPTLSQTKDRMWLNLTNPDGAYSQILIGYFDNATNGKDRLYDGVRIKGTNYIDFYSIGDLSMEYGIQGRSTFAEEDIVPLGYNSNITGNLSIELGSREGILLDQTVFIHDKFLDIMHDLTNLPYEFTAQLGVNNDRFEILYNQEILSLGENEIDANSLIIIEDNNGQVTFKMRGNHQMATIEIIDLLGRTVYYLDGENRNEITYNLSSLSQATYVARVTLSDGRVIIKKAVKRK